MQFDKLIISFDIKDFGLSKSMIQESDNITLSHEELQLSYDIDFTESEANNSISNLNIEELCSLISDDNERNAALSFIKNNEVSIYAHSTYDDNYLILLDRHDKNMTDNILDNYLTSYDIMYLKLAQDLAKQSTCAAYAVGAVITYNNAVIGTGYNRSIPTNELDDDPIKCTDLFRSIGDQWYTIKSNDSGQNILVKDETGSLHHEWSEINEVHAEVAAIGSLLVSPTQLHGTTNIYVTHFPCNNCAKLIASLGISRVYYMNDYVNKSESEFNAIHEFLANHNVELIKCNQVK